MMLKRYLNQLLEENIPEIMFVHLPARNESGRICLPQGQSKAVEKYFQIDDDDDDELLLWYG